MLLTPKRLLPFLLLLLSGALSGCFVDGRCTVPQDCGTMARCLEGACEPCQTAAECAALRDQNPSSPSYDQPLELIAFRGDVVLIYLANAS